VVSKKVVIFLLTEPLGLGFDDGLKSACLMLQYLSNGITKKLSDKKLEIKKTFQSPTMAPFCEDGEKVSSRRLNY
jgi:phosphomannomutase/phosphoglucomutase